MIVISDTTPINYLVLIREIELLPVLYSEFMVPESVLTELLSTGAPDAVRSFASSLPGWVTVSLPARVQVPERVKSLGRGEREAIMLAMEMAPAVVLTDDRAARQVAAAYGISTLSTLRVLTDGAELGHSSLEWAFAKLRGTNFRVDGNTLEWFLIEDAKRSKGLIP